MATRGRAGPWNRGSCVLASALQGDTGRALRGRRVASIGLLLLAAVLLLAQTLGLVHRSLHGSSLRPALAAAAADNGSVGQHRHHHGPASADTDAHGRGGHPGSALATAERLFGHDGEATPECRLYDQAQHADLLWAPPSVAFEPLPRPLLRAAGTPQTRSHPCAGFHARGPPALA